MRRYFRTLVFITVLTVVSVAALSFQTIKIGGFERGGDTVLGLTLGLDLQGGIDLRYQAVLKDPDTDEPLAPTEDQMKQLLRTIQRRVDASGLGKPNIQILGDDRLLVQLPGVSDPARAKTLIGETARLEWKHRTFGVDREVPGVSGNDVVSVEVINLQEPATTTGATTTPGVMATSTDATTTSATAASTDATTTPSIATSTLPGLGETPPDEPEIPGLLIEFTAEAAEMFAQMAERLAESLTPVPGARGLDPNYLTISVEDETTSPARLPYYQLALLPGGQIVPLGGEPSVQRVEDTNSFRINLSAAVAGAARDMAAAQERFGGKPVLAFRELLGKVDEDIGLTGEDLTRSYPGQDAAGLPVVNVEFNAEGTRKFAAITTQIAGTPDVLPIFLDDVEIVAPLVREGRAIRSGAAIIQGPDFTVERVTDISLLLESGRLPIPIELIRERDVDAILGADSLAKSVVAGLVGLALVLVFMVVYYRVPGVVAAAALMIYGALVLALFKLMPVTLELSGAAAAILSIGMAVDANILIFERMKEELRAGRTLLSSMNIGFNRAWPAIRDSNVSTLITCAILFWFADTLEAAIVKGFAITLAIGVGMSMFSAITVSRTFLRLTAATRLSQRLNLFVPSGGADLPQQQLGTQPA